MKVIRCEYKVYVDGEPEPELEGMVRVQWPDGQTLEESMEAFVDRTREQANAIKLVRVA